MKNAVLYPLIAAISFGLSGVGTYLVRSLTRKPVETPTYSEPEEEPDIPYLPVEEEPGFSKMINKLMDTQEVQAASFSLVVSGSDFEDISLTLSDLDLDITGLLTGDIKSVKAKANLSLSYREIEEEIGFYVQNQSLYLSYQNTYFAFDMPMTISSLLSCLETFHFELPSLPEVTLPEAEEGDSSFLDSAMSILENVEEEETSYGYSYTLDLNNFLSELGLPIQISDAKIALLADKEYNLIGVNTLGDGIRIQDAYRIQIDSKQVSLSSVNTFQGLSQEEQSRYQDLTSTSTNLFTTIANLVDKKSFSADYEISLTSASESYDKQDFSGLIQADLSTIQEHPEKGKYEISILHSSLGQKRNEVYALYQDETIYLKLNNLIKGKIQNSTIDELLQKAAVEIESPDLSQAEDQINSFLSGTDFEKLMNGDLSLYRDMVSSAMLLPDGIKVEINGEFFGFTSGLITLELRDTTDELKNGFFFSVSNLPLHESLLSFSLNVKPQEVRLSLTEADLLDFDDYSCIIPLYDTIADLIDKKRFNSSYSFMLKDTDSTIYTGDGNLSADMRSLGTANEYGEYRLSLNTVLNGYSHSVDAVYQDHDIFVTLDTFFHQKMSDSEISSIVDVVSSHTETDSALFDEVNDALTYFKSEEGLLSDITAEIKETGSLSSLEEVLAFSIDEENNQVHLSLNLPYLFKNTAFKDRIGGMDLTLSLSSTRLVGIDIESLSFEGRELDFHLSLEEEFTSFRLSQEEVDTYVEITNLSQIIDGFYNLPTQLKEFSVNLEGSVYKQEDSTRNIYLEMTGDCQVNLNEKDSPDVGGTLSLFQPLITSETELRNSETTSDRVNHEIQFTYQGTHDEGATIAKYTAKDGDIVDEGKQNSMYLYMQNQDIYSIYDEVMALKDKESNLLYHYLSSYFDTATKVTTGMPLIDAFKNKDYGMLLNDFVKKIEFTENTVTLVVDSSLLNENDDSKQDETIIIKFDENNQIQSATITGVYQSYQIEAEIYLSTYDASKKPPLVYDEANKDNYIDVHGFSLLLSFLITTTEHHYFDLSGDLNLPVTLDILGRTWELTGVTTHIECYVRIVDGDVDVYLSFNNTTNKSITDKGFYATEFFITPDLTYTIRTRNVKGTKTAEFRKLTTDEITSNIAYYLMSYILNLDDMKVGISVGKIILANVYQAMYTDQASSQEVVMTHNYSSLVKKAVYKTTENDSGRFELVLHLNDFITIPMLKFSEDVTITINFDHGELTNFSLNAKLKAVSLIDIEATLTAERTTFSSMEREETAVEEKMKRYDQILTLASTTPEIVALENYEFDGKRTGESCNPILGKYKYYDNGAVHIFEYDDNNLKYFYGVTI